MRSGLLDVLVLACWQRSMLPCAGRQQTARGLVTMPMLLALELYHSMLSTAVINDHDYSYC